MTIKNMTVNKMTAKDIDAAVEVTVRAFYDTPFYRYFAPDDRQREAFLRTIFKFRLEAEFETNETDLAIIDNAVVGMASWNPHRQSEQAASKNQNNAMEEALSKYPNEIVKRWFNFLNVLVSSRDQVIKPPFWALSPIAVLPQEQGKGIASQLIRKKLADFDKAALPCFLATQDKVNVEIYARYGFYLAREDFISKPDVVNWTMIRDSVN
jgi:ribosomal protein S18 acetylase RimI-like enzyme